MALTWFLTDGGQILDSHNSCVDPGTAAPPDPLPTAADILRAFRQVPLPASTLTIQPPGGTTLVNLATNFYTHATPFQRTLTLLGHHVTLRIHPTTYTWHFGDHTTATTTRPGAPYPTLDITHRYTTRGHLTPSVDTTWTADYQLDHHPWTPVPGTVTITGPTQPLTIRTATPLLTG